MSQKIEDLESSTDIAIVGIACRLPGARDKEQFWQNLAHGRESIVQLDQRSLEADHHLLSHASYVPACGCLDEDPGDFDAELFGIPDPIAEAMSPEHRIFLESAWSALEDAAYDPARIPGEVSIISSGNPQSIALYGPPPVLNTGNEETMRRCYAWYPDCIASNALYHLGLTGEAFNVGALCAGFHYAVHLACQSLLLGQADMAIAGGVTVRMPQRRGHFWEEGRVLSRDGHCRPFDAKGTGSVFSSGVVTFVLKPLDAAVRDRDHVYAVVKGSAINNNGARSMAYGIPQPERLSACIKSAMAAAGVSPETITLLEGFGIGLPAADAVEVYATDLAFRGAPRGACAIGSVKGNIGHCGVAAGGASAVKAALALHHRRLPPTINLEIPDPQIDFPRTAFSPQRSLEPWNPARGPRRAGVTTMGGSGHNAHMILEDAPRSPPRPSRLPGPELVVVSARSKVALRLQLERLRAWLLHNPEARLDDVCFSLAVGRRNMPHRWAAVFRTREELLDALGGATGTSVREGSGDGTADVVGGAYLEKAGRGFTLVDRQQRTDAAALTALADAWVKGHSVDVEALYQERSCRRTPLPGSPFERRHFWRKHWH
jgi:polyketide synthase PksJ